MAQLLRKSILIGVLFGCFILVAATPLPQHSQYLFVWAMEVSQANSSSDKLRMGRDFLATFDVDPEAASFGKLVAMLPVGNGAKMAHHTSYALPPNGALFANDWFADRTYIFDLHQPARPRLIGQFRDAGRFMYPHSFVYLPDGDTLVTFQYSGGFNRAPGGLVELDTRGRAVRATSAADRRIDPNIRPYSLAVVAGLNRVVTGSADMFGAQVSHVVQVWRLSDLKLLKTIVLPKPPDWYYDDAADSSEPRLLSDGVTIVVPTFHCGLYLVRNLAGDNPTLQHVYDFGYRTCEVPVVVGHYLVESMQSGHAIVSLDMHDPAHPREVGRVLLGPDEYPHWLAVEPHGNRLVITGYGKLATYVRFAEIDRNTGALTLESRRIDFTRAWPDGWKGSAIPHGSVFSND